MIPSWPKYASAEHVRLRGESDEWGRRRASAEKTPAVQSLDTPRDEAFDRITRLLSVLLNVPVAAVTLVDRNRQWFKSALVLGIDETPRDPSAHIQ
jgi:hypothetical protein